MIKAVIFDMDGLLVDSEPLWRKAEQEIFGSLGLQLSEEDLAETTGIRLDEVVRMRRRQHWWESPDERSVELQITARLIELIGEEASPLPGVLEAMQMLKNKAVPMAVASSSPHSIIEATIQKFGWTRELSWIQSAEELPLGKPHPEVYLKTARELGIEPRLCLAFEDSIPGMISAKAAGMLCVAIPEGAAPFHKAYGLADLVLDSMLGFDEEAWKTLYAGRRQ